MKNNFLKIFVAFSLVIVSFEAISENQCYVESYFGSKISKDNPVIPGIFPKGDATLSGTFSDCSTCISSLFFHESKLDNNANRTICYKIPRFDGYFYISIFKDESSNYSSRFFAKNVYSQLDSNSNESITSTNPPLTGTPGAAAEPPLVNIFSIASVIPKIATIGKPTIFTIQGENLVDGMDFSITNCNGSSIEIGSGTSTERHFLCTPLKGGEGGQNRVEIEAKEEITGVTQISNNFTIEYRDTLLRSCEATLSIDTFVLNIPYILFDSGQDRLSFSARFSHIGNENFELETYASEVVDPLDFIGCEPAIMNKSYHISIPKMKFGENSLFGRLKFIGKSNDGKLIFNGSGEFSYE